MSDTGRIPLTPQTEEVADKPPIEKIESPARISTENIEVPYRDYHREHGRSYLVEYFKLGDKWDDPQGGFPHEVGIISTYINDKIESGEVANSVSAIKELLKGMEKFNNLTKEERAVVKLEVLSNYAEFLMKNDRLKSNLRKYHG